MGILFLTTGTLPSLEMVTRPGGRPRWVELPVLVAVLTRPNGDLILVDAGYSGDELARPLRALGPSALLLRPSGGHDRSAACQLRARGLDPTRVTHIVATHLHQDHVGGFVDFPNAEVVATAAEYASGRERGLLHGYVHMDRLHRSGRSRPVILDGAGRYGFPRHRDLLGDGTVLLLDAAGHTAGGVVVHLTDAQSRRTALVAGDAAYSVAEYRGGRQSPLSRLSAFRSDWLRATWGRLVEFESAHPDVPVVLSHDADGPARHWHA